MKETSVAGIGVIITVLAFAAKYFNLDVDEGQLTEGINGAAQFVGLVVLVIGQLKRKDLKFGLIRR